jgi:peptidoglycan/LPS O-acetylase OafA/YrhL
MPQAPTDETPSRDQAGRRPRPKLRNLLPDRMCRRLVRRHPRPAVESAAEKETAEKAETAVETQPERVAGGSSSPGGGGRRLYGLDGLRAVAVAGVVLYHASMPWLPGGFLGVDVFFVLSGFLITSLLLAEAGHPGRIGIKAFYLRRARRLSPALVLVLVGTALYASVFARDAVGQLRTDVPAALGFATNWWFVARSESYLLAAGRPTVLAHLWSLAVEEQFYLAWPFVLWLMVRRWGAGPRGRALVCGVAVVAALLSTGWMALLSARDGFPIPNDPSRAYFGTDTHAFGLALGAALATVWGARVWGARSHAPQVPAPKAPIPPQAPAPQAPAATPAIIRWGLDGMGVAALLAVVWSYANLDEYSTFLYRGGFAVVDVVVLVLVVTLTHPACRLGGLLGVQPLRWLGLRSYGVYLWHWPVFTFTRPQVDVPVGGPADFALRLALTLGLAELSYRFVEVPIRTRGFRAFFRAFFRTGAVSPAKRRPYWPLLPAAGIALPVVLAMVGLYAVTPQPSPAALSGGPGQEEAASDIAALSPAPGDAVRPPAPARGRLDPSWPKTLTVVTDSVLLGTKQVLPAALPGWRVDYRGRPALMVKAAAQELRSTRQPVGSVVVVGLGYNSLWQKDRQRYDVWATQFDDQADDLLAALVSLGAKKVVWVALREASTGSIPASALWQQREYAWYFPYVNERLHAFVQRHPEVTLADWAVVSDRPGLTYDAIHLNSRGATLMIDTIKSAIGAP